MKHKLTLKSLDEFGLNSYESKSYLSLLEKKQLTASEVSRIAGIPRARVYETLENLETMGLCRSIPGKIKLYSAVDPGLLKDVLIQSEKEKLELKLHRLKDEILKEESYLQKKIREAEDLAEKLTPIYDKGRLKDDSLDYIELIKEDTQLQKRICQLIDSAEKEVVAFSRPPLREDRKKVLEQLDKERESLKKGVLSMCVYEIPKKIEEIEWLSEYIAIVSGLGEHVRVVEQVPIKMLVFDERTLIFQLEDPISLKPSTTSQIIQHRSLAKSMKILFETVWANAKSMEELDKSLKNLKRER